MLPTKLFAPRILSSALERFSPAMLLRKTGYRLNPPKPLPFSPVVRHRQARLLARGEARMDQQATLLVEQRKGSIPTIVLGGFVPDATEQVFLLRGFLLSHGSLYYVHYPRTGFSPELLFAQLDDLLEELAVRHGQVPVVLSVSFGCGLLLEWMKHARAGGRPLDILGAVFVSPVACLEDLLEPGAKKPSTLLGRAIKLMTGPAGEEDPSTVVKARAIFLKMFEAGSQNTRQLAALMTKPELQKLKHGVMSAINAIDPRGARERVRSLERMRPWSRSREAGAMSDAPTMVLFAEKESSVIVDGSPSRIQMEGNLSTWFPNGSCRTVSNPRGTPVQHASLIFHYANFLPSFVQFYKAIKLRRQRAAA